jgi:hypothetical protein
MQLRLVERRTLPGEASEVRPRISQYVLADHYLRLYFALVDPWRSAIQQGRGRAVLDHIWGEELDRFVSRAFEDVALQYLLRLSGSGALPPISAAGRWWFDGGTLIPRAGRPVLHFEPWRLPTEATATNMPRPTTILMAKTTGITRRRVWSRA